MPAARHPRTSGALGRAQPAGHRGATLVELMVAILLLTVGVLATAGTSRAVARELEAAHRLDRATWHAASRLDSLRAIDCRLLPADDSGADTIAPDARVTWTVARQDDGDHLLSTTVLATDGQVTLDLRARRRCPA